MANAQDSQPPAAITRAYDAATRSYESDKVYYEHIYNDLAHNAAVLERHTGSKPRVMVWPYVVYTMPGVEAAQAAGMPITMNLEPGPIRRHSRSPASGADWCISTTASVSSSKHCTSPPH